MSLLQGFDRIQLVEAGSSLGERLTAGAYHLPTIVRALERDMAPEEWTALEAPAVLILAEVCGALGLSEEERTRVLGPEGVRALAEVLESSPITQLFLKPINERQAEALRYVRRYRRVDHSAYRALCPIWSD